MGNDPTAVDVPSPEDVDGAGTIDGVGVAPVDETVDGDGVVAPSAEERELRERVDRAAREDEDGDAEARSKSPRVLDLAALKARARKAATLEERLKRALPFPLHSLECEVMVAPAHGMDMYERLFKQAEDFFQAEDGEPNITVGFIKLCVLNCVIDPVLDDEALELIIENDAAEFSLLSNFCQTVTRKNGAEQAGIRLGELSTEAQETFFESVLGPMRSQMPA